MNLTPVETIALILIVFSTIKLIFIIFNPQLWINFAKKVWGSPGFLTAIMLILGVTILKFLLEELTIVQIIAAIAFAACFFAVGFARSSNEIIKLFEKRWKDRKIIRSHWVYILIWFIMMIWGLIVILN